MIPTTPNEDFTPFLPTTYNIPTEEEDFRRFLNEVFCNNADVVNDKKIGGYTQDAESFNGEKWNYDTTKKTRNGYQVIARITSFVPQVIPMPIGNINPQFVITHVWGSASLPCTFVGAGDGRYFSFFEQGDARIQFVMTDTTITITTNGLMAAYSGFIVIEYLRDGFV